VPAARLQLRRTIIGLLQPRGGAIEFRLQALDIRGQLGKPRFVGMAKLAALLGEPIAPLLQRRQLAVDRSLFGAGRFDRLLGHRRFGARTGQRLAGMLIGLLESRQAGLVFFRLRAGDLEALATRVELALEFGSTPAQVVGLGGSAQAIGRQRIDLRHQARTTVDDHADLGLELADLGIDLQDIALRRMHGVTGGVMRGTQFLQRPLGGAQVGQVRFKGNATLLDVLGHPLLLGHSIALACQPK
jgi:hypothetical protein